MAPEPICTWGWTLPGGVRLGEPGEQCISAAGTPSPYGRLCDEHVLEIRLRLLLLPLHLSENS